MEFGSLIPGDLFKWGGVLYIKIARIRDNGREYNAKTYIGGNAVQFFNSTRVDKQ